MDHGFNWKKPKPSNRIKYRKGRLPAKMEAWVDTFCLLAQPKEGQQI